MKNKIMVLIDSNTLKPVCYFSTMGQFYEFYKRVKKLDCFVSVEKNSSVDYGMFKIADPPFKKGYVESKYNNKVYAEIMMIDEWE